VSFIVRHIGFEIALIYMTLWSCVFYKVIMSASCVTLWNTLAKYTDTPRLR
jgi:hypothetical protein